MKKLISSLSILILLFFLSISAQAKIKSLKPFIQENGDAGISVKALDINKELREFYKKTLNANANFTATDIDSFNKNLNDLESIQAEINQVVSGETGDEIVRNAKIFRAIAWIHGWASFSQLSFKASQLNANPALREKLISLDGTNSSLQRLVRIYAQISDSEKNALNPLRIVLKDDPGFIVYMSYREKWQTGEDNSGVTHKYYIPSSIDILGSSVDSIKVDVGRRHITSFWALVNLQLDTWHSIPLDPNSTVFPSSSKYSKDFGFQKLINWLQNLESLNFGAVGNDIQNNNFRAKIHRIAKFLKWKQDYQDESKLNDFINNIDTRNANGKLSESLGDLLEAAKPVDHEYLYPAAFWIRYVYLLSINNPRRALNTKDQIDGFFGVWNGLDLGNFILDRKDNNRKSEFLRWNSYPANGDSSALISDITNASWKLLEFERNARILEKTQYDIVTKSSFVGQNTTQQSIDLLSFSNQLDKLLSDLKFNYSKYISVYFDSNENITKFTGRQAYIRNTASQPVELTEKFVDSKDASGKITTKIIQGKFDGNFRTSYFCCACFLASALKDCHLLKSSGGSCLVISVTTAFRFSLRFASSTFANSGNKSPFLAFRSLRNVPPFVIKSLSVFLKVGSEKTTFFSPNSIFIFPVSPILIVYPLANAEAILAAVFFSRLLIFLRIV